MLRRLGFLVSIFLFFPSAFSYADLGGMGGFHGSMSGAHNQSTRSMRIIDEQYEKGKAIYLGRNREIGKLKLCLHSGDDNVKVKRATLVPFKGTTTNNLINNLRNCDQPEAVVFEQLGKMHTSHLVYYLNRRFKLELTEHAQSVIAVPGRRTR